MLPSGNLIGPCDRLFVPTNATGPDGFDAPPAGRPLDGRLYLIIFDHLDEMKTGSHLHRCTGGARRV